LSEKKTAKPITIRLMGTNVEAAESILDTAGLTNVRDLREAVTMAVATLRPVGQAVG
jgi:succinyl-CoA synthetase beta subunit